MKKAGRIVSYLLVLALVTTLLSGLGYANTEAVSVKASGNTLNVLEIVPSDNMATFGYMVKNWTDTNYASRVNSITGNATKFNAFNQYLEDAGLGSFVSPNWVSTDYFKTQVLGLAADDPLSINVTVKTPGSEGFISAVNSADFIIINETVPEDLQIGTQNTFNTSGCKFSPAEVMAIFKKVAGVEGQTPVPYIIDFKLMYQAGISDARQTNTAFLDSNDNHTGSVGYTRADDLFNGDQGIKEGQGTAYSISTASDSPDYLGSSATSYKLYKLLSAIDPATLYGLYFRENDGGYGIDKDLNIIGLGPDGPLDDGSNQVGGSLYRLNTKMSTWPDKLFRPNYLTTASRGVGSIMSKMGWFEAVSGNIDTASVSNFRQTIGGQDGRGVAYKSADGLFYATQAVTDPDEVDLSTYTDIASSVDVNYNGNVYWGTVTITNKTNSTLSHWKVTFSKEGLNKNLGNLSGDLECIDSGSTITLYVKPGKTFNIAGNTTTGTVIAGDQVGTTDNGVYNLPTIPDTASGNKIGRAVNSFRSLGSAKNDYHPYRILIISENLPADPYANRTVIAEMVKAANDVGKGLAGGIFVDCVSRPQFENIPGDLNQTYDMICTVGGLTSGTIGANKLGSFSGTTLTLTANSSASIGLIVDAFKDHLLGQKIGVDYITVPTEYYTSFTASFAGENWQSYQGLGDKTVTDDMNYINNKYRRGYRKLDFAFKVTGTSSYSADLYVDVDGDFKYEDDEKVSLTVNNANNNQVSIPLSNENFFGEGGDDYVGGFAWKLVVKSGTQYVSRIGYSAICNETDNKNVIKILQIYPTEYMDQFDKEKYPHPLLILPTQSEINLAIDGGTNADGVAVAAKGDIGDLDENDDFATIEKYFDNIISIDTATGYDMSSAKVSGTGKKVVSIATNYNSKRDNIIKNASLLYYFLDQLKDYDIDVTRYSVSEFNSAAGSQILLDTDTGRLAKSGGESVKNLDGSDRYGYDPGDIGLTGNWSEQTVSWTEGIFKKYLVDGGKVYGERGNADGSVTYYGSTHGTVAGVLVTKFDKNSEFDLLMIGFGDTLDWMAPDAISLLKEYLVAGGPAFVGNGAISTHANNTFGWNSDIRNTIGISTTYHTDYNYETNATHPVIETNDTIFSHYPYTINSVMKATGDGQQPYRLALTGGVNDPIVAFAKYVKSDSTYGTWANAAKTYYVYKKNNIVFCGFGCTFSDNTMKQQGGVLPMAETLMIVNALVASSRFGSSPIHNNPYIDCVDDDCSVLDVTGMEPDQILTNEDGDTLYYFKDSVYTDYDAYDIAEIYKTDSTQSTFNKPVQNSGLGIPGVTIPESWDAEWKSNIRWIPYEATLPTEAGGYIEFKTVNNATTIELKVYSVSDGDWVTPTGGKYKVSRNGTYYIGVPLNGGHSAYSGITSSKLGFMIDKNNPDNNVDMFALRLNVYKPGTGSVLLERHTISMIRRVLYHAK